MEPWSLFPGVYTNLIDTSFSIAPAPSSSAFICFMSQKGPDNRLELIGRADELMSNFGTIDVALNGQGLKVAMQWLTYSNSLYCIRVTPDHTNCSAMDNIYKGLYGAYQKSAITMREASYANLGIATNEEGEIEFIYVGPENLGTILSTSTSTPPATPQINDRYYIPDTPNATGTWAGHEGEVAICISPSPVVWAYKEVKDTSQAVINNVPMTAAVTYDLLPSLALWKNYENVVLGAHGPYTEVRDFIYELPATAVDGDSYLVCDNPTDSRLAGHGGQVITYDADDNEWTFELYNKVFIDAVYTIADAPSVTAIVGDRYIISDAPTEPSWIGHERMIAEKGTSAWKIIEFDVAEPEETDKFQSIVITKYISALESQLIEYKRQNVFVKNVIWTSDMNATFVAYAHRTQQISDIISNATPTKSIELNSIEPFILFYPIGRGSYYNNIHIDMKLSKKSIHEDIDFKKTLILDIYDTIGGAKVKVESYEVSFNPNARDLSGNSVFIQDVINMYSNRVMVAINREAFNEDNDFCKNLHSDLDLLFQRYKIKNSHGTTALPPKFEHGDDGTIYDKYGNLDWEQAKSLLVKAYTGQIINPAAKDPGNPYETDVLDREMRLFDLVFDAAYPQEVKMAILTLIDARHQDCFGVLDLGFNASAKQGYEARTKGAGVSFNTPFIALYEPFSRIYDAHMGTDIWITPVYHVARAIAITDRNYGRHQAPAGVNRGMCPEIKELAYNLNREPAYQDLFVSYNINPIIQNRDGFMIWGQSTSYLRPSKYQDINIVRMVLKIKRDLEFSLRAFIFDLNDSTTWILMDSAISSYLGNLVSQKALNGYSVKVYASDYDISRHRCRVDILLDPKMVLYQILLTIAV